MNAHAAWDHPQLADRVVRPRRDGCSEVAVRVAPLHDARQVVWLEQSLRALPGVRRVAIDRIAQRVRVVWDARLSTLAQLLDAFAQARCPAQPLQRGDIHDARADEMRDALKRLLVAGMCTMQVMTYAFVIYIGVVDFVDFSTLGLFRWLGLATTVPLVFYSARPFFAGAAAELRAHRPGIHLPVALAVGLVFLASTYDTLRSAGEIYFDSISMFVFLLLAARYLELRAHHRSGAQGDAVTDAVPLLARRHRDDGSLETVAASGLVAGDRVHIAEGEAVPADGVLESASAQLDEALLSGESRPVRRHRGERLVAGSVVLGEPVQLRVEQAGAATGLARLAALATRARLARDPAGTGDPQIARFVARVLWLTALTALGWLLFDAARAFDAAVAVLVVACPCAFALAGPVTRARALGLLARRGVLVVDANALAALARVDCAVFDKTGTLGTAQFDVGAVEPLRGHSREQVLAWAAALATESSHPLARALGVLARQQRVVPLHASAVCVTVAAGIHGVIEGRTLRLGRAGFALAGSGAAACAALDDALVLADAHGAVATFHPAEHPRDDARRTVDALRRAGIACCIASGDSRERVSELAGRLGIDDWHARQSPTDKLALLHRLRDAGHVVLAVGDGSNDAPLLAGADVSAALADGTGLAQAQAGLLLLDGRLDGLLHASSMARQAAQAIARGRRWSLWYNLAAVPFAAFGFVPPWLAGIGMSLSSLAVVFHAMRVGGRPPATASALLRELPA